MPAAVITPILRLPPVPGRQGEGGRRLEDGAGGPEPLLSVVTVVLNGAGALARTMESVLCWPRERVEYILVDGGSTDATLALLRKYDRRLTYWVSEPDQGISHAFNKGISLCRGRVVGLLNCGDWYEKCALAEVERAFTGPEPAGVLCGTMQYRRAGSRATLTDVRPELLTREMSVAHPACFVAREVYLRHGAFDPDYRLAMDYELMLRLSTAGVRFVKTGAVLANMEHDGVSEVHWRAALEETHRARQAHTPDSPWARPGHLRHLILRKRIRFFLQRIGLHGLVRLYRERLAPVRKIGDG